ncbi:MAG: oxidoreductase [Candidatus Woesearchaeota archaeon]
MKINKETDFLVLKGKVIVIAGGTGLIGNKICHSFSKLGAIVIIASRNVEKGKALEKELNINGKSKYFQLDINSEESIIKLIDTIQKQFTKIDSFINCSWPKTNDWVDKNIEDISYECVKENLVNHLGGYFLCCQKFAKFMKEQGFGNIINFSSIYGIVGPNFSIYENTKIATCPPAYPLIKGGIITMTKYFATYFAKYNVRVNCISPGGISNVDNPHDPQFVKNYSDKTPMKRMGQPEEVCGAVIFLASDTSSYITGHNLVIDGGWTAW